MASKSNYFQLSLIHLSSKRNEKKTDRFLQSVIQHHEQKLFSYWNITKYNINLIPRNQSIRK